MNGAIGVGNVADSSSLPTESTFQSSVGVASLIGIEEYLMCEVVQSGETKSSLDDDCSITATSITGLTTEIGFSEMNEMIG